MIETLHGRNGGGIIVCSLNFSEAMLRRLALQVRKTNWIFAGKMTQKQVFHGFPSCVLRSVKVQIRAIAKDG